MLHLVFITHGSTGDTVPMIRLAEEAVSRGHRSTLLTGAFWRETTQRRGIRFVATPPHGERAEQADFMRRFSGIRNKRRLLEEMFSQVDSWQDEILPLLDSALESADALVCSYLFPFYHRLAEGKGLPTVSVHFCPNTYFSPEHPPADLPTLPRFFPRSLRLGWNRGLTSLADRYLVGRLNKRLSRSEQHLASWLRSPAGYNLILAPASLFRGSDTSLPCSNVFTGFLAGGFSAHETPPAPDEATFDGGPLLTFGSVTTPGMEKEFEDLYRHWPGDRRLTIQKGWFRPPPPPSGRGIRIIGPAPHRELFARASVLIHHGGAGTTTSALLAGKPQILIPHFADQDFWAQTVGRLGCGRRLPFRGWGRRLARVLERVENDRSVADRARAVGDEQAKESGARNGLAAIERWLGSGRESRAAAPAKV
ncbi:MAG: glycosyltransferase [Puniceicoccaceae bacterium]